MTSETAKSRLDLWMTVFTGILAFFAFASFIALSVQLYDARKSFAADERPYIWIANEAKENPNLQASVVTSSSGIKQFAADLRYTNFGKSPAVLIRQYHGIILGSNAGKIIPRPWISARTILPNGKVDFFSAVSGAVSDQDIAHYMSAEINEGITVYATWQYADTSGNRYETEICFTRLNLGAWAYCNEHNDIKDCSESPCEP
jgi:hypothetical protein